MAKSNGLMSFEIPKTIFLESELFSPENDLLTPTFKSKRKELKDKYMRVIESLYAEPVAKSKM